MISHDLLDGPLGAGIVAITGGLFWLLWGVYIVRATRTPQLHRGKYDWNRHFELVAENEDRELYPDEYSDFACGGVVSGNASVTVTGDYKPFDPMVFCDNSYVLSKATTDSLSPQGRDMVKLMQHLNMPPTWLKYV